MQHNLLDSTREVFILVPRDESEACEGAKHWAVKLTGLSPDHIRRSVSQLKRIRNAKSDRGCKAKSDKSHLKTMSLQRGCAKALGAESYEAWRKEYEALTDFLHAHGLKKPTDLIRSKNAICRLTARQVSDRLFNSNLPLPRRIFTGVGHKPLEATGIARLDLVHKAVDFPFQDDEIINWCLERSEATGFSDQPKNRDGNLNTADATDFTGRQFLLADFASTHIQPIFNLLGDSLVEPSLRPPEIRLYNTTDEDIASVLRLHEIFRDEIESGEDGWVTVLPYEKNRNLIFLAGQNGEFDWVVRDQRESAAEGHPFKPFQQDELPSAMNEGNFHLHLYYRKGHWAEKLEHDAETRHYRDGGTVATWPGYGKLVERHVVANNDQYCLPSQPKSPRLNEFVPHALSNCCLMVSKLVTVGEFDDFLHRSNWSERRQKLINESGRNPQDSNLDLVNLERDKSMPVAVTWLDAIAYCKFYEDTTGIRVRLLRIEDWKQIRPMPLPDPTRNRRGDLDHAGKISGLHDRFRDSAIRFDHDSVWFQSTPETTQNSFGLPFVIDERFGEWLGDCSHGRALAANSLRDCALTWGPLERSGYPVGCTMRYKGMKVGFRLCYIARTDA